MKKGTRRESGRYRSAEASGGRGQSVWRGIYDDSSVSSIEGAEP